MPFEPWYIEFTEPGAGTRTSAGNTAATGGSVIVSGGASTGQSVVVVAVTPSDLAALQAQLFAAITAEASARAGADTSEAAIRAAADQTLTEAVAALHGADTQIYQILINGTGTGGGGGGADNNDNGAFGIACIGTNVGTAAYQLAATGSALAWEAFVMTGSTTGAGPDKNDNGAFSIACIGTNTGTAAYQLAATGSALAWEAFIMAGSTTSTISDRNDNGAFGIACIGTNVGTTAYQTALEALSIAQTGTTGLVAANGAISQVLSIAVTGTNNTATGLAAADGAIGQVLAITVTGTNNLATGLAAADAAIGQVQTIAVNGSAIAVTGSNLAVEALNIAQAGTNKIGKAIVLCAGFTPLIAGPDVAELPVPYYPQDGTTALAWTTRRLTVRVQVSGSASVVAFEKSTGTDAFTAVAIGTVSLPAGAYESYATNTGTNVTSGDKLRFNVLTLGSGENWSCVVEVSNP